MSLTINEQLAHEAEGGQAALQGKLRADCPYNQATQSGPWNHWVYGNDNARGELAILEKGVVEFCTEESPAIVLRLPVAEAIANWQWKPKYVTFP